MRVRWSFLILTLGLPGLVRAATSCEVTLATAARVPAVVSTALSAELRTLVTVSDRATRSFDIVEARVAPLQKSVAAFLQNQTNAPSLAELDDLAAQGDGVYGQIQARLATLRDSRVPPAKKSWWPRAAAGVVDVEKTVRDIRLLHHTLLPLEAAMRANVPTVERAVDVATELRGDLDQTIEALRLLREGLESDGAEVELLRRLTVLGDDLEIQKHLLQNLAEMLAQRLQLGTFFVERVRRLVHSILPMEALLGATRLDFSPLSPAEVAQLTQLSAEPKTRSLPTPVETIYTLARQSRGQSSGIVTTYLRECGERLTAKEVVYLIDAISYPDADLVGRLLWNHAQKHAATLSIKDVELLKYYARSDFYADNVVVTVATAQWTHLSEIDRQHLFAMVKTQSGVQSLIKLGKL